MSNTSKKVQSLSLKQFTVFEKADFEEEYLAFDFGERWKNFKFDDHTRQLITGDHHLN